MHYFRSLLHPMRRYCGYLQNILCVLFQKPPASCEEILCISAEYSLRTISEASCILPSHIHALCKARFAVLISDTGLLNIGAKNKRVHSYCCRLIQRLCCNYTTAGLEEVMILKIIIFCHFLYNFPFCFYLSFISHSSNQVLFTKSLII